jgi:hypothetical protein
MAAPTGILAAASGSAATVAPSISNAASTVTPVLYHVPITGKQVLSLALPHGVRHTSDVQSANWAGYADSGTAAGASDTYSYVAAQWTEPTVTCPKTGGILGLGGSYKAAYSSFWVGLDGYTSSSVEQTGTDADCATTGAGNYYAWYEMYPAGSVTLPSSDVVRPGDVMKALVQYDPPGSAANSYDLAIQDVTRGWFFAIPETEAGLARSSAEFVAEAPSQCSFIFCHELPLAHFSPVTFSNATATDGNGTAGPIDAFQNDNMAMVDNGTTLATTSGLSDTTSTKPASSSFTVTWNAS